MASLLRPASSCPSFRLPSSAAPAPPPSLLSRRHKAPPAPPTPRAPPSRPRVAAAAAYGGAQLLGPVDTQTFIIAASVVAAVSLSLVLGLKVSSSSSPCFLAISDEWLLRSVDFVSFSLAG
ncbi:hypothetical protein D1007_02884 [Hordeum vulgare]|nr:hypothetical protein D1007_02884 [Hordeum vulgare]